MAHGWRLKSDPAGNPAKVGKWLLRRNPEDTDLGAQSLHKLGRCQNLSLGLTKRCFVIINSRRNYINEKDP